MLRSTLRNSLRPLRTSTHSRRSFVSTVLLSKTYEDKTVAELRTELRARGLSGSGTKQALISRIKQADARSASEVGPSSNPTSSRAPSAPSHSRDLSSSVPREEPAAPTSTHTSVSPSTSSPVLPVNFNYKLPDVSQGEPETSVQIPFVPDFWESSVKKAEEAAASASSLLSLDPSAPKIMLAAGASTYPAGGPTYAMSPATDTLPSTELPSYSTSVSTSPRKYDGILGDVLDDLGIPHNVLSATPHQSSTSKELTAKRTFNRPLDEEERRGAYTLLGLVFGAWVVAGLAAPSSSKSRNKKRSGH